MTDVSSVFVNKDNLREKLAHWYNLKKQLSDIKAAESKLRRELFAFMFKDPVEGSNKFDLQDGYEVRATHVIDRTPKKELMEEFQQLVDRSRNPPPGCNDILTPEELAVWDTVKLEELLRWKPELSVSAYRKLTPAQLNLFDRLLVIKEGSPQLDVKPATRRTTSR